LEDAMRLSRGWREVAPFGERNLLVTSGTSERPSRSPATS
jgi:hypothetical protein